MKIKIIGGGLAGTACAYILKMRGHDVVLFEKSGALASGASGNSVGLYNPRFTAEFCPQAEFYSSAFFLALSVFATFENIGWFPCGALHLVTDEKKARRFPKTLENWAWGQDDMQMLTPAQASVISGIEIKNDALYLPRSGVISPQRLCQRYAQDIDVRLNTKAEEIPSRDADCVILACAIGAKEFPQGSNIPLKPVRGQVSLVRPTEVSSRLRTTIGFGGYIAPAFDGIHCLGSTFQPWLDHDRIEDQDDQENLQKLRTSIPSLGDINEISNHRAGVRTTTKDHFPVIGAVADGVFISAGHGSHGILSSLMGAFIIADLIEGKGNIVSDHVLRSLRSSRFQA